MSIPSDKVKRFPRWIIVLLFVIIVGAATGLYFYQAQKEFTNGMAAYKSYDCLVAVKHFEQVTGMYKLGSSSRAASAQALKDECDVLNAANEMRTDGEYLAAVDEYKTFTRSTPNPSTPKKSTLSLLKLTLNGAMLYRSKKNIRKQLKNTILY